MEGKDTKNSKNIYIWLIIGSAVVGMIFSILYLGFEIFIPAASALSLCMMFFFILAVVKKYPDFLTSRQKKVIKIIAWVGMIAGFLAAVIQLILFFKF